jgi:hypothetical protein
MEESPDHVGGAASAMVGSPGHVGGAASAMVGSPAHEGGAASAMVGTPAHMGGTASAMVESPGHTGGAAFVMEESPAHVGGAVVYLELGPWSNEKDRKRMEKNGGIRPGKKWPQYLAASLGTCLLLCIAEQLKVAAHFRYYYFLFVHFVSSFFPFSSFDKRKWSCAVKVCRQKLRLRYVNWFAG